MDEVSADLELASSQILGLFNRTVRKTVGVLSDVSTKAVEASMGGPKESSNSNPALRGGKGLSDELEEAAKVHCFFLIIL